MRGHGQGQEQAWAAQAMRPVFADVDGSLPESAVLDQCGSPWPAKTEQQDWPHRGPIHKGSGRSEAPVVPTAERGPPLQLTAGAAAASDADEAGVTAGPTVPIFRVRAVAAPLPDWRAALDAFGDAAREEVLDAAPLHWSSDYKCGFSVFDEDEVLGGSSNGALPPSAAPAPARTAGEDGDNASGREIESQGSTTSEVGAGAGVTFSDEDLAVWDQQIDRGMVGSRVAVNMARRLCCLYTLPSDAEGACPICLEAMTIGQIAWRLPCFHQAHRACAERFFGARRMRPLCPLCRLDVRRCALPAP